VLDRAVHQAERRVGVEPRHLALDLPRLPHVVGIQKRHVAAAGGGDPGVPRRGDPAVCLPQHADPVAVRRQELWRRIRGAVVHDDHLEDRKRLSERAVDRLPEKPRVVVGRNDDGDGIHAAGIGMPVTQQSTRPVSGMRRSILY
jgi:hypothetical protein